MHTDLHAQIIDIMDRAADLTIATVRHDGFPQATVVGFVHDNLTLYVASFSASQKVANIVACDKVSATITPPYGSWGTIEGLSIGGHASVVEDVDERTKAGQLMMNRYPQIVDYMPHRPGEAVFIRIDPVVITVLDYARGFGHSEHVMVQDVLPPAA
jgi:general stress protein 26